jgi:hypothetical protein
MLVINVVIALIVAAVPLLLHLGSGPDRSFATWFWGVLTTLYGLVAAERVWQHFLLRHIVRTEGDCLLTVDGRLPRVRELSDPRRLGVRPARHVAGDAGGVGDVGDSGDADNAEVPTYVPRDVDARVRNAVSCGGFVLLVGEAMAGKSRCAYEAVRACAGDYVLVAPRDRAALPTALQALVQLPLSVLWLDDLERFVGPGAESLHRRVRRLEGYGRVIVATARAATAESGLKLLESWDVSHEYGAPTPIRVRDQFTDTETARAAQVASAGQATGASSASSASGVTQDASIADALAHADRFRIPAYLAAGPDLLAVWTDAAAGREHRRGAALVSAAVDLRRAGLIRPLPRDLVESLHERYLTTRDGAADEPSDDLASAWAWATESRNIGALLTVPDADAEQVEVSTYLVEHLAPAENLARPDTLVAEPVLSAALEFADAFESSRIGDVAHRYGLGPIAAHAYQVAAR